MLIDNRDIVCQRADQIVRSAFEAQRSERLRQHQAYLRGIPGYSDSIAGKANASRQCFNTLVESMVSTAEIHLQNLLDEDWKQIVDGYPRIFRELFENISVRVPSTYSISSNIFDKDDTSGEHQPGSHSQRSSQAASSSQAPSSYASLWTSGSSKRGDNVSMSSLEEEQEEQLEATRVKAGLQDPDQETEQYMRRKEENAAAVRSGNLFVNDRRHSTRGKAFQNESSSDDSESSEDSDSEAGLVASNDKGKAPSTYIGNRKHQPRLHPTQKLSHPFGHQAVTAAVQDGRLRTTH